MALFSRNENSMQTSRARIGAKWPRVDDDSSLITLTTAWRLPDLKDCMISVYLLAGIYQKRLSASAMQYDSVQLLKTDRWRFLCPTKFNRIRGRRTTAQADSILTQPGSRFELRLVRLDYPNIWGTRLEHFRNLECKLVTTRSQLPYV